MSHKEDARRIWVCILFCFAKIIILPFRCIFVNNTLIVLTQISTDIGYILSVALQYIYCEGSLGKHLLKLRI